MAHARKLIELNAALHSWLVTPSTTDSNQAPQLRLANYRAPQATLIVSNAAVATLLRYRQHEILAWLEAQTGERFTRLEINIRALPGQR